MFVQTSQQRAALKAPRRGWEMCTADVGRRPAAPVRAASAGGAGKCPHQEEFDGTTRDGGCFCEWGSKELGHKQVFLWLIHAFFPQNCAYGCPQHLNAKHKVQQSGAWRPENGLRCVKS